MNPKKLEKVISKLCESLEVMPLSDPIKVFLLDSLSIYLSLERRVIKQN
jgi:hypothetical protein